MYRLSKRSLSKLEGVHPDLCAIVRHAIQITPVDFCVFEGIRSVTRQKEAVAAGRSKTMRSRHLTGHAVDLVAWVGRPDWTWRHYPHIAHAVQISSLDLGIPIIWGAAWDTEISRLSDDLDYEAVLYRKRTVAKGIRPLIDGPHFELPRNHYP